MITRQFRRELRVFSLRDSRQPNMLKGAGFIVGIHAAFVIVAVLICNY